ncbi:M23 family metallopeptidase [Salinispirillum marinum]|uniref:M23 family metallopeptidase n=2 Tax=Saccharospirillaceae TaxID=255527 RepID=A0ABV8BCH6_9GAMM
MAVWPAAEPRRVQIELAALTPIPEVVPEDRSLQDAAIAASEISLDNAWQAETIRIEVEPGDTLSHVFDRAKILPTTLFRMLNSDKELERRLVRLQPGNVFEFQRLDGQILSFTLHSSRIEGIQVTLNDDATVADWEAFTNEPTRMTRWASGTIDDSLFLAARDAGLSDTMTMNLAQLFGWDVDFALDIRQGDEFTVIYEELYVDGEYFGEGRILAASFVNQGNEFHAIRYTDQRGVTEYYDAEGRSVRKAFLRTPLEFARISSHFNPNRRHPILNTIRAHRGTDYAAPTGTPIRAAGDGRVVEARYNGGYGNVVVLQHGQGIRTLYAHMSRFGNGVRSGVNVRQGQIIGYVGTTGASTGPHLHYEFLVNGVHVNPVTVRLPDAQPVHSESREDYRQYAQTMMTHLQSARNSVASAALSLNE